MAILKNTTISDTGYLRHPVGTTAQRPANPAAGMIRFNTDINDLEYYNGSSWMQFTTTYTNILSNGLVMYLDASNISSYPGSGSTWFDLSGNGHNISLGSSVTFSSTVNGCLNFAKDANGFGRNTSMNLSSSNFTIIGFSRKNVAGDDGRVITAYNNNWLLGHHDTTYGDYYAEGWVNDATSPQSDTTWRMYTGTGNLSSDVYQLYINNNLIVSNSNGSAGPNGWNLNSQYGQISNCQISLLIAFNRVLSSTEISVLFNVFKDRHGI